MFPKSLYMMRKYFGLDKDKFTKYVICAKCSSLYTFKECFNSGGSPKICAHIAFCNQSRQQPCHQRLLKEIVMKTGKKHYPIKTYYYYPLTESLHAILTRPLYLEKCELLRKSEILLGDIYEGQVWKDFQVYKGFLDYSSQHACWKCTRKFKYDETLKRVKISSIDTRLPRMHEQQKRNATKTVKASSSSEWNNIESQYGSRFSEIMHPPYYDCVRFAIIDPMHNIFLGTAKRMLQM